MRRLISDFTVHTFFYSRNSIQLNCDKRLTCERLVKSEVNLTRLYYHWNVYFVSNISTNMKEENKTGATISTSSVVTVTADT